MIVLYYEFDLLPRSFLANDSAQSIGSIKRPMTACDSSCEQGHVKQWIPATHEEEKEGGIVRYGYGECGPLDDIEVHESAVPAHRVAA